MQCLFVAPAGATLRIDTRHRAATGFFDVLLHLFEIIGRCIVVLPCDFHRHGLVHWFNRIDIRVDQGRETLYEEFIGATASVNGFLGKSLDPLFNCFPGGKQITNRLNICRNECCRVVMTNLIHKLFRWKDRSAAQGAVPLGLKK